MTPLPPPSPTTYTHLLSILHFPTPSPLEIDILPFSHSPQILYDPIPASLGIPKALLIPLYIHAHNIFFSHLPSTHSNRHSHSPSPSPNNYKPQPIQNHDEEEAYNATTILLLHDPTHTTALNFRKARLLALKPHQSGFKDALQQELHFLTSLLTSPLVKHNKASTLWAHRLWVVRLAPESVMRLWVGGEDGRVEGCGREEGLDWESGLEGSESEGAVKRYWDKELEVVMKAGERHPRNYYAWAYARDLLRELAGKGRKWGLARAGVRKVQRWCLQHPRDVSGWAFLEFLLREVGGEGDRGGEEVVRRVVWETRQFVRKFEWRGESITWFLKSVQRLEGGMDGDP